MTEKNKIEKSLIPIDSTGLVRARNSIEITKKILNEGEDRSITELITHIKIGKQQWMSKNLEVDCYANGDPIPQVQNPKEWENLKTGAWCYYNNEPGNGDTYGKLYNWHAVQDPRGLAPNGFKIPCKKDFTELCTYLDNEYDSKRIESILEIKREFMGGTRSFDGEFSETLEQGAYWGSDADEYGASAFYVFDEVFWMVLDGYSYNLGFRVWCIKNISIFNNNPF